MQRTGRKKWPNGGGLADLAHARGHWSIGTSQLLILARWYKVAQRGLFVEYEEKRAECAALYTSTAKTSQLRLIQGRVDAVPARPSRAGQTSSGNRGLVSNGKRARQSASGAARSGGGQQARFIMRRAASVLWALEIVRSGAALFV